MTTKTPYSYHVAKAPTFPNTPLCRLEQAYGASEYLPTLKTFIQETFTSCALLSTKYNRHNVHNAVHIMLPSNPHVNDHKHQKTIHATLKQGNGPQKQPSPAYFDTALVIEDEDLHQEESGLHGVQYYTSTLVNFANSSYLTFRLTCC